MPTIDSSRPEKEVTPRGDDSLNISENQTLLFDKRYTDYRFLLTELELRMF